MTYWCQESEAAPVFIRPPMKDKAAWTGAPDYERYLHIRVYKPEGLDYRELKCALTCGTQHFKTGILDIQPVCACTSYNRAFISSAFRSILLKVWEINIWKEGVLIVPSQVNQLTALLVIYLMTILFTVDNCSHGIMLTICMSTVMCWQESEDETESSVTQSPDPQPPAETQEGRPTRRPGRGLIGTRGAGTTGGYCIMRRQGRNRAQGVRPWGKASGKGRIWYRTPSLRRKLQEKTGLKGPLMSLLGEAQAGTGFKARREDTELVHCW